MGSKPGIRKPLEAGKLFLQEIKRSIEKRENFCFEGFP